MLECLVVVVLVLMSVVLVVRWKLDSWWWILGTCRKQNTDTAVTWGSLALGGDVCGLVS